MKIKLLLVAEFESPETDEWLAYCDAQLRLDRLRETSQGVIPEATAGITLHQATRKDFGQFAMLGAFFPGISFVTEASDPRDAEP